MPANAILNVKTASPSKTFLVNLMCRLCLLSAGKKKLNFLLSTDFWNTAEETVLSSRLMISVNQSAIIPNIFLRQRKKMMILTSFHTWHGSYGNRRNFNRSCKEDIRIFCKPVSCWQTFYHKKRASGIKLLRQRKTNLLCFRMMVSPKKLS